MLAAKSVLVYKICDEKFFYMFVYLFDLCIAKPVQLIASLEIAPVNWHTVLFYDGGLVSLRKLRCFSHIKPESAG